MIEQKSIRKNFIYNMLLKVLNIIFPLVTFPYVARILSPDGIGKVDFSLSIIQYFILLAQVGIPTYAIRECARYRDNQKKLTTTVQEILVINFIMIIVSYVLFTIIILNVESLKAYRLLLLISSINILSTSIGIEWFYQAIEEYKYITIRSIFVKLISLVLIFILIRNESDYIIYGAIIVMSISIAYIYNFFHANKYIKLFRIYNNYDIKRHLKPILTLFAMSISISIYVNLDKVMLGFISGDVAVGLYTAANKMVKVVLALVTSLGTVLLPRMSYYIENNKDHEIKLLISKSFDFILMSSIPSTIGIFMLAKPIIILFAGREYIEAITTIRILSPIIIIIGLSNLIGIQILVAYGKEKITLISAIAGALVNFTLNMIFIPLLQQDGAAIGTLVAEMIVTIIQLIFVRSFLKGNVNRRNIISYLIGGILIVVITSVFDILINNIIGATFVSVIVSIIVYFGFLYFTKNELVHEIINKLVCIIKRKIQ